MTTAKLRLAENSVLAKALLDGRLCTRFFEEHIPFPGATKSDHTDFTDGLYERIRGLHQLTKSQSGFDPSSHHLFLEGRDEKEGSPNRSRDQPQPTHHLTEITGPASTHSPRGHGPLIILYIPVVSGASDWLWSGYKCKADPIHYYRTCGPSPSTWGWQRAHS